MAGQSALASESFSDDDYGLIATDVEEVPIDRLHFGFSPRKGHHEREHVAALGEVFDRLPPILVHAGTMGVIDGIHRVHAARARGETTIRVSFFHGSDEDASIQAVQSNVTHGKPLTVAEREEAAQKIIAIRSDWSDRRIAAVCGLSPKTVGRIRGRATEDSAQLRVRVGRDGVARPIDPTGLRHRVAEALKTEPGASIRAIAERTGASQGTVRDVRRRVRHGQSILPPKLMRVEQRQLEKSPDLTVITESEAYRSTQAGHDFAEWFETTHLKDDAVWQRFVDAIPISRIYEVADAARTCGEVWVRFASALESRANNRLRHHSR